MIERWNRHDWQLIHAAPQSPALHMALDEVITDEVGAGRRPPTLRVWEWASSAVVIGRFQSLRNEVDPEGARHHGIGVVRRISGGGAMFIEPGNTITYSLSAPESLVEGMSFQEAYAFMDAWLLKALRSLGIAPWFIGLGGRAYLATSVILGAMFVHYALRVRRVTEGREGDAAAKKLFLFSILYLFALFLVLLVEHGLARFVA